MARSRFMLASSVVLSDRFLGMSPEAQALNTVLNAEADVTGLVVGVGRIVRGSGLGSDALAELEANGYVLRVGSGDAYLTHCWVHNKFDKRLWQRMADCEPYTSGELVFVGDEGRSRYELASSVDESSLERRSSVDESSRNSNCNGNGNGNVNPTSNVNGNPTQEQGEGEHGEGEDLHHCLCKRCGAKVPYATENHRTMIHCPTCGTYEYRHESGTEAYSLWNDQIPIST